MGTVVDEQEKEWNKYRSIFSPVKTLVRATKETLKRQRKLVIFPLRQIVQEDKEAEPRRQDHAVMKRIKNVINEEEKIIMQRTDFVLNPLIKLQKDTDRDKIPETIQMMRDKGGNFLKTLESISNEEKNITEQEETLVLRPLREIIRQEEEIEEAEDEDKTRNTRRILVLISIVIDQETIVSQLKSSILLPIQAILREAKSSAIFPNSSQNISLQIENTLAPMTTQQIEEVSTTTLATSSSLSSETPLETTTSVHSNSTSLSPKSFMNNTTKITVLVLSILLILSILSFMVYMIKQQYDTRVKGRAYNISEQAKRIQIPRAKLTPEAFPKNLKYLDDFDDDF